MKTKENPFDIPRFAVCSSMKVEVPQDSKIEVIEKDKYVANKVVMNAKRNETVKLIKYVAVTTSRDYEENNLNPKAYEFLEESSKMGYEALKKEHCDAWRKR